MDTTVVGHPLAAVRLTRLRDHTTARPDFRRALAELSMFVVYEALRDLPATAIEVITPLGPAPGIATPDLPLVVPVMRAGLGMLDATLSLVPDAEVGFVGLRRDEATFLPHAYLSTIPDDLAGRAVLVLDPMLATGGSLVHTCHLLREANAGAITVACVLAAPEGIEAVAAALDDVRVITASIDERLNEQAFIVPGLGDAGDRQFGLA
jgi:uracil phosphoribosyltransferase